MWASGVLLQVIETQVAKVYEDQGSKGINSEPQGGVAICTLQIRKPKLEEDRSLETALSARAFNTHQWRQESSLQTKGLDFYVKGASLRDL